MIRYLWGACSWLPLLVLALTSCFELGAGPRITEFWADPSTVEPGETVVLSWQVDNLQGAEVILEATEAGSDVVSLRAPVTDQTRMAVTVDQTTTYRLIASGITGTSSRETTVSVTGDSSGGEGAPTISFFTASPTGPVEAGETVRLQWAVEDADRVTLDPPGGSVAVSGSDEVQPFATTTYTLRASNESGTSRATVRVEVKAGERLLFLVAGQSNASGAGLEEGGSFPTSQTEQPADGVFMLSTDRKWVQAKEPTHAGYKHSFLLRFGKEVQAATGMDVYLVPAAVGGSALDQWQPGSDHFDEALSRAEFAANSLGIPVAAVVWFQGESDTKSGSRRRGFVENTDAVLQGFHQQLEGSPQIVFVQLSKRLWSQELDEPGDNVEGHNLAYQVIREEQRLMEAGANRVEVGSLAESSYDRAYYHMAVAHDLPMSDAKHVSAAGQRYLGQRIANTFLSAIWQEDAQGTFGQGPRLEGLSLEDGGHTVLVNTTLPIEPAADYDGYFTVFEDSEPRTPNGIGRDPTDPTRIKITFAAPLSGKVEVRYMPPQGTGLYTWSDQAVHANVGGLKLPLPAFGMPVEELPADPIPGVRMPGE
ncbi:MAG: sialate O-acetylesterase [Trueperaceae bacterium]